MGIESLINEVQDIIPLDYKLKNLDEDDIVIGVLTEEEQKICTYISYISDLLLERGVGNKDDEIAIKMISKINVYKEILFYLVRERLNQFKYDEYNLTIKKGFKVVLEKPVEAPVNYIFDCFRPSLSRFGD